MLILRLEENFGVPMGSPISVTTANIVMEKVEQYAILLFSPPPRLWIRYVDDTLVILNHSDVAIFHDHINNLEKSIKFTVEKKKFIGFS